MLNIVFSKNYKKLWGQNKAILVYLREIDFFNEKQKSLKEYDTLAVDGSYFQLKNGKYLQLVFLGNKGIPFCTLRPAYNGYGKSILYYTEYLNKEFEIIIKNKGK